MDVFVRELKYIWYYFDIQFRQIIIYYIIGIVVGSLISVFAKGRIHSAFVKLGEKSTGVFALVPAALLGIASPLCLYGTIPLAYSFSLHGVRADLLAAFMMCSILLNPQLIAYSVALGAKALAVRIISAFICGITAGLLVRVFFKNKSFFNFSHFEEPQNRDTDTNIVKRVLKNILRNLRATGPLFLLGIFLSAIFQRYIASNEFFQLFDSSNNFGVFMAATVGVPLYACGGGTIPLLKSWLEGGMSLGSAAAFMITGPATKITNLGALKIALGLKNFLIYLSYVMVFAFITGVLVNII